ncbi:MAG: VWA-like domain-containing protein, partial [Thermofilaceae archaeon]
RGVRMIVAVDVSGSIDTYTLRRFLEETLWAYQLMGDRVDGEVWFWDAEIQGKVPLKELAENLRVTVTGRGGTVIDPVADELLEEVEKNPVDVFVVFTDGLVVLEDPDKFNEALRRVQLPIIVYTIQPIEELGATQIHYPVEE